MVAKTWSVAPLVDLTFFFKGSLWGERARVCVCVCLCVSVFLFVSVIFFFCLFNSHVTVKFLSVRAMFIGVSKIMCVTFPLNFEVQPVRLVLWVTAEFD